LADRCRQLRVDNFGPIDTGTVRIVLSRAIPERSESITTSCPRSASAASISTAANSAPPAEFVVIALTIFNPCPSFIPG
jgi:hypothetical protein